MESVTPFTETIIAPLRQTADEGYQLLFEKNPLPMWVYDLETLGFLAVNEAAVHHYGYSRAEFLGMTIREIRPSTELPALAQDIAETGPGLVAQSRRVWKHQTKKNEIIHVEITSHDLVFEQRPARLVLATDVTAKVRADAASAELAAIVQSSDDAIIGKNLQGIVTSWNAGAEKMFGYSAEEMVSRSITVLIPPDRKHEEADILGRISRGERLKNIETVRVTKSGRLIDLSLTISPIRDAAGRIVGVSKVARDITDRKRADEELRQLNEELEKRIQERTAELEGTNRELEAFSYSVSHDLRAPLRHIEGYVELVVRHAGETLNEKSRGHLRTVSESVSEMGKLIDDLLDFCRMGKVEMRQVSVSLDQLVGETIAGLERDLEGRNVVWKRGPLPAVQGDPSLIRQVLVNLLSNAVKYTRPRNPAEIEIGCAGEEDNEVVIFVRDNGVGFDMKYAHKLFGVFQRLHHADEFEGTGVGLASVRRIITRHGGRIWAESILDHGSTFFFTLSKAKKAKS